MVIYLVPGTGTILTARGFNSATCIRTVDIGDASVSAPMSVSAECNVTRSGVSREMVKVAIELPRTALQASGYVTGLSCANVSGVEVASAHTVVTVGPLLTAMLRGDATSKTQGLAIIKQLLAANVAVNAQDRSLTASTLPDESPIVRGILGQEPLNTVGGQYGQVVA